MTVSFTKVYVYDGPSEDVEAAFSKYALWKACSNVCVYDNLKRRLRVDVRRKRIRKCAFTKRKRRNMDGA